MFARRLDDANTVDVDPAEIRLTDRTGECEEQE
jgi:hypothetical protein